MEKSFNTLIDSFIDNEIGIAENFISLKLAGHLRENITELYSENRLKIAGTGNNKIVAHNKMVRSDVIYWLDRKHDNQHENDFFDLMDSFILHLNQTCYTGITGYEFHYTMYEKGSFYKKHYDQFQNNSSRKYSMIMYLNVGWKEGDGGELCIYHDGKPHNISPENGRGVFFKSDELEHEVLVTNSIRMSVTGWLKVD